MDSSKTAAQCRKLEYDLSATRADVMVSKVFYTRSGDIYRMIRTVNNSIILTNVGRSNRFLDTITINNPPDGIFDTEDEGGYLEGIISTVIEYAKKGYEVGKKVYKGIQSGGGSNDGTSGGTIEDVDTSGCGTSVTVNGNVSNTTITVNNNCTPQ